ncbi:MAG: SDR family NAD(P)-dependent oxidoreductase [Alphaproteobacteria bacterium]|nr:SDR family NAD(P)-dependent oxidoreductase [Alphaproteobacteria bacterium]
MKTCTRTLFSLLLIWAWPCHAATVLITGANRGLGLEFVRQYAARDWIVIAITRAPETSQELNALSAANTDIKVERLDVTDMASIKALALKYKGVPIDILINNAGVLGDLSTQRLESLERNDFQRVMMTNAFGPLAMAEAFREHVRSSEQKKIVAISSGNSIVSGNSVAGGLYAYRSSKAALNILMRGLATDLAE